jgi:hypothetical protein
MRALFLIFLIFMPLTALRASEDDPYAGALSLMRTLEIPKQFDSVPGFNPTTYLEMFTAEQVSRFTTDTGSITKENETKLRALFRAAIKSGRAKYEQDYWIAEKAPMVQLLAKVSPDVLKLEVEPGGGIHMFEIGLTLDEEQQQATEKSTGVSRSPDAELGEFYGAELPKEMSHAFQMAARIHARNRFGAIALPRIAMLIGEENDDFFLTLWWQHTNRSVRTSILAILLCRNDINEVAPVGNLTIGDFDGFSERFAEPEAKLRKEEVRFVKENFRTIATKLARMTKGVERVSKLFAAYTTTGSIGVK